MRSTVWTRPRRGSRVSRRSRSRRPSTCQPIRESESILPAEICGNALDDDCDGQTDCSDADCVCDVRCPAIMPEDCGDGMDNDADTLIDAEDWDCPRRCA